MFSAPLSCVYQKVPSLLRSSSLSASISLYVACLSFSWFVASLVLVRACSETGSVKFCACVFVIHMSKGITTVNQHHQHLNTTSTATTATLVSSSSSNTIITNTTASRRNTTASVMKNPAAVSARVIITVAVEEDRI